MRVAVRHTDPEHPNAGWFAYGVGRAEDFVHPLTGETISKEDVLQAMQDRALAEYPAEQGYEHQLQTLTESGDWVAAEQAPEPLPPGEVTEVDLEAAQVQAPEPQPEGS